MAKITAASPMRDPALMAEWSLLSSCIGDMEESDLMAFDEDLADYVPWDDEDVLSPLGGKLNVPSSCASPVPLSPLVKRGWDTSVDSPAPPKLQRPRGGRRVPASPCGSSGGGHPSTPPPYRAGGQLLGTPHAELLELSPSDLLRQCGDTPSREALARLCPSRHSSRASVTAARAGVPTYSSRHAVLEARRGKFSEDDFLVDFLPLKAVPMVSAALPASCKENARVSASRSNLVRRICFSAPSAKADAVRHMMERARLVKVSIRRSTFPFSTIKPPPASIQSLRTINRMVNKAQRKLNPRGAAARARIKGSARAMPPLAVGAGRASPRAEAMLKASFARMAGSGAGIGIGSSDRPPALASTASNAAGLVKPKDRASRATTRDAAAWDGGAPVTSAASPTSRGQSDVLGGSGLVKIVPIPMLPAVDPLPSSTPVPGGSKLHGARSTFGSFGGLTLVKVGLAPAKAGLRSPTPSSRKITLGGKAPSTAAASVAAITALSAPPAAADKPATSTAEADPPAQAAAAADGTATDRPGPKHASPKRASPKRASPKHSPLQRSSPRRTVGVPARLSEHFKSVKPMAGGFKFTLGGACR